MEALARVNHLLTRAAVAAAVVLFGALFATVLLQVAFRYVLRSPLVWTEEAARYLYIWVCYLGWVPAYRGGHHIVITALVNRLPRRLAAAVALGCHAVAACFFAVLVAQGVSLAARSGHVLAIAFPLPWSAIYAAAPVAGVALLLQAVEYVGHAWAALRRVS